METLLQSPLVLLLIVVLALALLNNASRRTSSTIVVMPREIPYEQNGGGCLPLLIFAGLLAAAFFGLS